MKNTIRALAFFAIIASAASITAAPLLVPMPDLVTREWHFSPPDKVNSRVFGVIEWDQVPLIKIGISEEQLRAISPAISPLGDVDGLIYSVNPRGVRYEIEVMIRRGKVSDISFKPCLLNRVDTSSRTSYPDK
ncbi:hypothetical protein [Luteolibacter sp. AS25]|uniref:hypothetical protein n=1 Tax=Luteolibacter sp. AS25 TaxID=3135776 RepID=UPI00398B3789